MCLHTVVFVVSAKYAEIILSSDVRHEVLVCGVHSLEPTLNQNRLRPLGHGMLLSTEQLSRCALLSKTTNGWRKSVDHIEISLEKLANRTACVCAVRLPSPTSILKLLFRILPFIIPHFSFSFELMAP